MTAIVWAAVAIGAAIVVAVVWGACIAAGRADARSEELARRLQAGAADRAARREGWPS